MDNVKCDIAKHLSELGAQLHMCFPETDNTNNWIRYPFHARPPVHLPISEQESFIEIATSGFVKIEFNQKLLPDFWIGLLSEFLALANCAVKVQDLTCKSVCYMQGQLSEHRNHKGQGKKNY